MLAGAAFVESCCTGKASTPCGEPPIPHRWPYGLTTFVAMHIAGKLRHKTGDARSPVIPYEVAHALRSYRSFRKAPGGLVRFVNEGTADDWRRRLTYSTVFAYNKYFTEPYAPLSRIFRGPDADSMHLPPLRACRNPIKETQTPEGIRAPPGGVP